MEIKLYNSSKRNTKLALLGAIFFFLGLSMVTSDYLDWIGWISFIFMGIVPCFIVIYNILDKRPLIVVNNMGIYDRTAHKETINWEVIKDAHITYLYDKPYLALVLQEEFEPSYTKGKLQKAYSRFNKSLGFEEVTLSLGRVDLDEQKFLDFVLSMIDAKQGAQRMELLSNASFKSSPT